MPASFRLEQDIQTKGDKMKKRLILALALVLVFSTVALAWTSMETVAKWKSGDAGFECVETLGYDFGLKIDGWSSGVAGDYSGACNAQGSCELADAFNNTITISNNDGKYFDWAASPFALGAVVVKAGPGANIFYYDPAASSDTGLYGPEYKDISHASFCWDLQELDKCYQDETAWAKGERYVNRGNWAMYVAYDGEEKTVDLIADGGDGVGMLAGTVTFSAPVNGKVTITVNLDNSFIFYYDLNDDKEDDNFKVQDYGPSGPPHRNPKVGRFDWKKFIPVGSTTGSMKVPVNSFYGVHLDVAYEVPCP
jgi:hypothetical protein